MRFQADKAWGNGFGAGFHFANFIFFVANKGRVVQVMSESMDLQRKRIVVTHIGQSDKSSANDGMSCHNRMPPVTFGEKIVLPAPMPTLERLPGRRLQTPYQET